MTALKCHGCGKQAVKETGRGGLWVSCHDVLFCGVFFSFLFVFKVGSCMNVLLLHYVPYILHEIGQ